MCSNNSFSTLSTWQRYILVLRKHDFFLSIFLCEMLFIKKKKCACLEVSTSALSVKRKNRFAALHGTMKRLDDYTVLLSAGKAVLSSI